MCKNLRKKSANSVPFVPLSLSMPLRLRTWRPLRHHDTTHVECLAKAAVTALSIIGSLAQELAEEWLEERLESWSQAAWLLRTKRIFSTPAHELAQVSCLSGPEEGVIAKGVFSLEE